MRAKCFYFVFPFFLILSACMVTTQSSEEEYSISVLNDKFNPGITYTRSTPILLVSGTLMSQTRLKMSLECAGDGQKSSLFLRFSYKAESWAFMNKIRLLIDGKVRDFEPYQSPRTDVGYDAVIYEYMDVFIPPDYYDTLINAQMIDLKIYGTKHNFEIAFNSDTKMKVKSFVKQYCTPK